MTCPREDRSNRSGVRVSRFARAIKRFDVGVSRLARSANRSGVRVSRFAGAIKGFGVGVSRFAESAKRSGVRIDRFAERISRSMPHALARARAPPS